MNETKPILPAGSSAPAAPPASMGWQSILFIVAGLVIVIDHVTKLLVEAWIPLNTTWAPIPTLEAYFRLTHTSNTGAAFGLFPGGSPFFAAVAVGVALFILVYNYRLEAGYTLLRVALGLQLGGAMGNLIDRLRLGHVTDFFDIGPWPVFNMADLSVVTGVILLGFLMFREQRQEQKERAMAMPAAETPPTDSPAEPSPLVPLYLRPLRPADGPAGEPLIDENLRYPDE